MCGCCVAGIARSIVGGARCESFDKVSPQYVQVFGGDWATEAAFQGPFGQGFFPADCLVADVGAAAILPTGFVNQDWAAGRADDPNQLTFGEFTATGDATTFRDVPRFRNGAYLITDGEHPAHGRRERCHRDGRRHRVAVVPRRL